MIAAGTGRQGSLALARSLSWVTFGYNVIEGIISVAAVLAASVALVDSYKCATRSIAMRCS